MDQFKKIMTCFELHSVDGIIDCFTQGIDPNDRVNDKPLIYQLINMYTRGPLFRQCVRAFVNHGLEFDDQALLAVLLDDGPLLEKQLREDKDLLLKRYSLDGAFTPLYDVTLLHICAEYNHVNCAEILIQQGAAVNAKAGLDRYGFGGHSPVFHTVNQDAAKSLDMLKLLISQKADLAMTVTGLIWGKGYDWETFIPSVNPLSYAMMGLLRQFQRTEKDTYAVVSLLLRAQYGIDYMPPNIPNKYLSG